MATWAHRYFRTLKEATSFLNGVIQIPKDVGGTIDLDGLTLIIDKDGGGNRTVTFVGTELTAEDIVTQIAAAHADLSGAVTYVQNVGSFHHGRGQIFLRIGKDDGSVYTIRGNGTANPELGLPSPATPANDVVGTPYTNTEAQLMRNVGDQNPWVVVTYK